MNRSLTHSLPAKVGGIFLMVILSLCLILSGLAMAAAFQYGIYDRGISSYYETNTCYSEIINDLHGLHYMLEDGVTSRELDGYYSDLEVCNLRFAGYNTKTGQYLSNDAQMQQAMEQIVAAKILDDENLQVQYSSEEIAIFFYGQSAAKERVEPDSDPVVEFSGDGRFMPRVIQWDIHESLFIAGVIDPLVARDAYFRQHRLFSLVYSTRVLAPLLFAICAFAAVADLIFLCCAAGHRWGREDILPNLQDRLPLDLYLAAAGLAGVGLLVWIVELLTYYDFARLLFALALSVLLLLVVLAVLLTLCTRFKLGKWWRNTVIHWCWRLLVRICRGTGRGIRAVIRLFPLVWRSVALACVLLFAQTMLTLLMFDSGDPAEWFLVTVVVDSLIMLTVMVVSRQLQQLREAGAALACGEFDRKIDTSKMRGSLWEHGEDLNSLGKGLSIAVEQKMRSERLKTELITNVSHDIKTPLTSIINYVDLLQKDPTQEERAAYLEVLDRQAKRLKKLTEDLVEASKASTGNLTCQLAPTSLRELLDQALGEYEDRLAAARLEPVVAFPAEELSVMADGRLLWRVLDNLLNNACKYAQSGTRLYLDVHTWEDQAVLTIKNISRQQLNLPPDELMERFVRGDSSRNTEGSGLGLNIAKSLVELQKGTFTLSIDGDLFKAVISLHLLIESEKR